jgi:hypothetical protein
MYRELPSVRTRYEKERPMALTQVTPSHAGPRIAATFHAGQQTDHCFSARIPEPTTSADVNCQHRATHRLTAQGSRASLFFAIPFNVSHYFDLCIPIASLRQTSSEHGAQAACCPADPPPLVFPSPFTPLPNPSHTSLSPLVPRHSFERSSPIDTPPAIRLSSRSSFHPPTTKHECLTEPWPTAFLEPDRTLFAAQWHDSTSAHPPIHHPRCDLP